MKLKKMTLSKLPEEKGEGVGILNGQKLQEENKRGNRWLRRSFELCTYVLSKWINKWMNFIASSGITIFYHKS